MQTGAEVLGYVLWQMVKPIQQRLHQIPTTLAISEREREREREREKEKERDDQQEGEERETITI